MYNVLLKSQEHILISSIDWPKYPVTTTCIKSDPNIHSFLNVLFPFVDTPHWIVSLCWQHKELEHQLIQPNGDYNPDLPIDEQTGCIPYDSKWEFPKKRLRQGMRHTEYGGSQRQDQWSSVIPVSHDQ